MANVGQIQYYKTPAQGYFSLTASGKPSWSADPSERVSQDFYYQAMPYAGNTPYGYIPISAEEFVQGLTRASQFGNTQAQAELQKFKNGEGQYAQGYDSGYRIDPTTGNLTTQSALDNDVKNKEGVANGTLKEVKVGNGTAYVPIGSAGDLLMQNPEAYYAKYPEQRPNNAPTPTGSVIQGASAPSLTGSAQSAAPGSTGVGGGGNTDLGPYADLYKQMQDYLDKLQKNGQVINPNVQITPDQLAAFATQAATQIHPYYRDQLASATDSFLSNLGYNTEQFKTQIAQQESKYGRSLETLGASAADRGFAQSGIRQKEESQLATDTQSSLDQLRGSLFNSAQGQARQFATTYGGAQVPNAPQIGGAPRVISGQSQFDTTGSNSGIYQLDPNIYSRLIGSEQNSEKSATDTLASQLATNSQQLQANSQARSLL